MATSALDATVGGSAANTFATLVEADQFHDDRPPDAAGTWAAATTDEKNKALLWAAMLLDSLYDWNGHVVTETQAMLWPRTGMYYANGYIVPSTVVPDELKNAQAEFARQLLLADRAADRDVETQGITRVKAGSIEVAFKESGIVPKVVPDSVINLIPEDWGEASGRKKTTVPLERV